MIEKIDSEKALNILKNKKLVGIIGYPGAGKTTLAKLAKKLGRNVLHTDDFLQHSHDDRPYKIMEKNLDSNLSGDLVVEGNEVTRLIKRGVRFDALILVTGSTRNDVGIKGLQGRVNKFIDGYQGTIYQIDPRTIKDIS